MTYPISGKAISVEEIKMEDESHPDHGLFKVITDNLSVYYFKDSFFKELHRDGAPAVSTAEGFMYFNEGKISRSDGGPTVIKANGDKQWTNEYGDLHNVNGPALITKARDVRYYLDGLPIPVREYETIKEEYLNEPSEFHDRMIEMGRI